jgi:hypothetical protein
MGHIKRSALQESEVLIPSANVMVELNAEMQPVVDEMIGLKVQSCKLGELRDALLPKLISGEIDVSEVELPMQPNNQLSGVLAPGADAATAAVLRNMSDAPVYNVIITCVGIIGQAQMQKAKTMGTIILAVPVSAFSLPERGMHGFQRIGRACMYGQRPRQLSLMRTGGHRCGEATASWKR